MKTVQREIYLTSDGVEYTDFFEATAAQAVIDASIKIQKFLDSLEDKTAQAKARMKNDIEAYVAFAANSADTELGEPKEAQPSTPAPATTGAVSTPSLGRVATN